MSTYGRPKRVERGGASLVKKAKDKVTAVFEEKNAGKYEKMCIFVLKCIGTRNIISGWKQTLCDRFDLYAGIIVVLPYSKEIENLQSGQLGGAAIIAHVDLVGAKSVTLRFRLRRKLRRLPCTSSPQKARSFWGPL